MAVIDKPLTNLQLELLQLYSTNLGEEDLLEIKRLMSRYFADKATDEMDKLWAGKQWSDQTMNEWLSENASN